MKIPISQVGERLIKCPECGHAALVRPAQMRMGSAPNAPEILSAHGWWLVDCPHSGKKLYPTATAVELIELAVAPVPEVSHVGSTGGKRKA